MTSLKQHKLNQQIEHRLESFTHQNFGWVEVSYGDELCLHFVNTSRREHLDYGPDKEGDWILLTSASLWELERNNKVIVDHSIFDQKQDPDREISQKFTVLVEQKVESIEIKQTKRGFKTKINFTGGFSFDLSPNPQASDLPLWELFTPTEQVFTLEWEYPHLSSASIHDPA